MAQVSIEEAMRIAIEHHLAGRSAEAEGICRQILAQRPDNPNALHLLSILTFLKGHTDAGIDLVGRAIAISPAIAEYHNTLGDFYRQSGQCDLSIASYRRAIDLDPNLAEAHGNLGLVLQEQGRLDEAIAAYKRAAQLGPELVGVHNNLGILLSEQGQLDEAVAAHRRAIELEPNLPEAHSNLGVALKNLGRPDEAIVAYRRAIELKPDYAEAHNNLGVALKNQGRLDEAIAVLNRAIALKPDYASAWNNLGSTLKDQGKADEAITAYYRAIALEPDLAEAHYNHGNTLKDQGRLDEALASFRKAVELKPTYSTAASNLVFYLHYDPDQDARANLAEHRRWDAQFAAPLARLILPHTNEASPDRRLKIGYVSPDFREHIVGFNLLPLFREHDHRQFEIFCYSGVTCPDGITQRFQGHADAWREVGGRTDDDVAQLVRADCIDVLVDLALHTDGNRLLVFARKPAPVQVSFAGYPGTTGLSAIDYRLTDPYLDPPGLDDPDSAEELVRLPDSFWCYDPSTDEPAVNSLAAQANGFITFGCLNHFVKINGRVLELWARVLRAVDRSRLLLLAPEGQFRGDTLQRLEQMGVAPARVAFVPRQPRRQYLEVYHGIDVMLDTFPYNGHTTSLDALWMGVPVVTLVGETTVGRAGLCQLTNVGLPELVAATPEEFVRIAVELAGDLPRLECLRATLRDRMRSCPLMDAPGFAHGIEAAYRTVWQRWCARHGPSNID